MKRSYFMRLTEEHRTELGKFIKLWKTSKHGTKVLEDGLRYLSSDERKPAVELIKRGRTEIGDIACVYGRGARPKLSLSKEDAIHLLEVVVEIRSAGGSEEQTAGLMEMVFSALLEGKKAEGKALKIVSGFQAGAGQGELF